MSTSLALRRPAVSLEIGPGQGAVWTRAELGAAGTGCPSASDAGRWTRAHREAWVATGQVHRAFRPGRVEELGWRDSCRVTVSPAFLLHVAHCSP